MHERDREFLEIVTSRMKLWLEAWEESDPPTADMVAFHYRRICGEVEAELGYGPDKTNGNGKHNGNGNGNGGGMSSGAA